MKWVGYLGLSFAVSFTVLLGFFSDKAYAASTYYNQLPAIAEDMTAWDIQNGNCSPLNIGNNWSSWADPDDNSVTPYGGYSGNEETYRDMIKDLRSYINNGDGYYIFASKYEYGTRTVDIIFSRDKFDLIPVDRGHMADITATKIDGSNKLQIFHYSFIGSNCDAPHVGISPDATASPVSLLSNTEQFKYEIIGISRGLEVDWSEDYTGEGLPEDIFVDPPVETSNWKPDIKLHQGENWVVELSDYNFFTFDKVAFTCGEHELAPVINWEVWDIEDPEDRKLIDTLVFGAPALVTYNAPKIQEDKRYEIVAYYSDCEGFNFEQASTKQFTVRKDGSLNPTDYMNVCIMETFPFINIPDCMAEINDLLVVLSFRVPDVEDLGNPGGGGGGQGWAGLVDGCRQLQVLDDWILSPDVVICPQMPSSIRNIVTPIVTFAMALGVITFVVQRQGMRGISG